MESGPLAHGSSLRRLWHTHLAGTLGIRWQQPFLGTLGAAQAEAVYAGLLKAPGLVFAQNLKALLPVRGDSHSLPPIALDVPDIEHVVLLRRLLRAPGWPGARLRLLWLPALLMAERRAFRLASRVFVCSETDSRHLQKLFRLRNVRIVPNAVDVPHEAPVTAGPRRLLFIGSLDYDPNALAAERLVARVWPRVAAAVPGAELLIVGRGSEHVPSSRHPPEGVHFLGFVEDLASIYGRVRALACPLTYGGGTRVKIVEAAAQGRAVISTAAGAEGLAFEDGKDILLREDDEGFARACIDVLLDDDLALRLGRQGHLRAQSCYSRSVVVSRLSEELRLLSSTILPMTGRR
jgi:glycosyltransferase involved in cell wall biosynthesis